VLVYLDTNVINDVANFIFGDMDARNLDFNYQMEVDALHEIFDIAAMVDRDFEYLEAACSPQLEQEFLDGQRLGKTQEVLQVTWSALREAWENGPHFQDCSVLPTAIRKHKDERHWLSACSIGAKFLLTRDKKFIKRHKEDTNPPNIVLPTQFVAEISKSGGYLSGLFLH